MMNFKDFNDSKIELKQTAGSGYGGGLTCNVVTYRGTPTEMHFNPSTGEYTFPNNDGYEYEIPHTDEGSYW